MNIPTLWQQDGFTVSTDKNLLDLGLVLGFLHEESYWAREITLATLRKSIVNSTLCFGLYQGDPAAGEATQIGFARVMSDFARMAHLADVFILPAYRRRGLGKWLLQVVLSHPELQKVRRFTLNTNDAHSLYAKFGFQPISTPENAMERLNKNLD